MPKIKTRKSIIKRLRLTGAGKLVAQKMTAQHRARFKSTRAKRQAGSAIVIKGRVGKKLARVIAL